MALKFGDRATGLAFDRCDVAAIAAIDRSPAIVTDYVPDAPLRIRELPDYSTELPNPYHSGMSGSALALRRGRLTSTIASNDFGTVMLLGTSGGFEVDDVQITAYNRYSDEAPVSANCFVAVEPTSGRWYLITWAC